MKSHNAAGHHDNPADALKVTLELATVLEHCRCSICMGIIKNARAISACMHRFCRTCIEAWLRAQMENRCPQCRVQFSSKRDCKADPSFDLLLGAMFGDVMAFEKEVLEPSSEVLKQAKVIGQQIAKAKHQAALKLAQGSAVNFDEIEGQSEPSKNKDLANVDATVRLSVVQRGMKAQMTFPPAAPLAASLQAQHAAFAMGSKQQLAAAITNDTKKPRITCSGDNDEGSQLQYRGVRFQGDNWQARTKRAGKELSLGLYNTAEEAGMAYDLDRLHHQGGKAQRLNFPLLRQQYKQILTRLADLYTPDGLLDFLAVAVQAASKSAQNVPGATLAENIGPAAASATNPSRGIAAADATQATAVGQHFVACQQILGSQSAEVAYQGFVGSLVHVTLEAGRGLMWHKTCLACPAATTMDQLAEAVAMGISHQHTLLPGPRRVALAVANDLDAQADFDAIYYEDSATGILLLRGHVTVRDLLSTLQHVSENLSLEYHNKPC